MGSVRSPETALQQIYDALGISQRPGVVFAGAEPVLPTPVLLATAGAAALGAVGSAVDALWQLRGSAPQRVSVDLRHAAAACRSYEFMTRDGKPVSDQWQGLSGFFACQDGRRIRFHCNFAHHDAAVRRVIGCDGDRAAAAAAVRRWHADELEDAVLDAGGCAYMVRRLDEWRAHPQAGALNTLPIIEVVKIGDAPAQPLPAAARPLSGIRALDLTRVIAGPTIGRTLAEHGADVMRIASPNLPSIEPLVIDTGHGKLSAHIDLETEDGRQTLRRLLKGADVFTQGYRPGAIARHGFAPEDIARDFPGTVCVSLSAWSHAGPWAARRGFDSLVQCATGWADELGNADDPKLQPAQAIDYVSGYLGAFGTMEALRRRALEGGTWLVRLSLAQTGAWIDRLGRNTQADVRKLPVPGADTFADMIHDSDTAFGAVRHLGPVLGLSETPPFWALPASPLGSHGPVWPPSADLKRTAT